jgi:hypothetical protein
VRPELTWTDTESGFAQPPPKPHGGSRLTANPSPSQPHSSPSLEFRAAGERPVAPDPSPRPVSGGRLLRAHPAGSTAACAAMADAATVSGHECRLDAVHPRELSPRQLYSPETRLTRGVEASPHPPWSRRARSKRRGDGPQSRCLRTSRSVPSRSSPQMCFDPRWPAHCVRAGSLISGVGAPLHRPITNRQHRRVDGHAQETSGGPPTWQ